MGVGKLVAVLDTFSGEPMSRVINGLDQYYFWDLIHDMSLSRQQIIGEYGTVFFGKALTPEEKAVNNVEMLKLFADFPPKIWDQKSFHNYGWIDRNGTFYLCGNHNHGATLEKILWIELGRMPDQEQDLEPAYKRFLHVISNDINAEDWEGDDIIPTQAHLQTLFLLRKVSVESSDWVAPAFVRAIDRVLKEFGYEEQIQLLEYSGRKS